MAKKPTLHPHSDRQAFERLMVLLATLVRYPGVGSSDRNPEDAPSCQALERVRCQLTEVAMKLGIVFPPGYPSIPTLRKDVETLRKYGILDDRRYSWGYYLGTGAMEVRELQFAFQALASQAEYQADPEARKVYRRLSKRLKGLDMDLKGELFYPVRQQLNQAIHHTDPEEMRAQQKYRDTLFNQLAAVEQAILAGRGIEIFRTQDRYGMGQEGFVQVYPLQLVYHNISWYLVQ
ncbi:hypothetical protein HC928_24085 [bacterium]|nr:hypothetical protein [bacterium]